MAGPRDLFRTAGPPLYVPAARLPPPVGHTIQLVAAVPLRPSPRTPFVQLSDFLVYTRLATLYAQLTVSTRTDAYELLFSTAYRVN
jgi:hypothetical protein